MIQKAVKTLAAIDAALENAQEDGRRKHLGASVIGRSCGRQIAMSFRWFTTPRHNARMVRLFNRGHLEEARFLSWLRLTGATVWDVDSNGNQFRIADCDGHFGGSKDAVAVGIPDLDSDCVCLNEFKTHNDKSFQKLVKEGVRSAKFEHYVQMCLYMHKNGFKKALYLAINKNDDDIWGELIDADPATAEQYIERARRIIFTDDLPPRVNSSPGWFECKFCDYIQICHFDAVPEINCRTCAHVTPIPDGQWRCAERGVIGLTEENQKAGCNLHIFNPSYLNGVEVQALGRYPVEAGGGAYVVLRRKNGTEIVLGENHTTSKTLCDCGTISKLQ